MFAVGQYVYAKVDPDLSVGIVTEVQPFPGDLKGQRVTVFYWMYGSYEVTVAWDSRILVLV